ncbi:DUF6452 family protein [Leeuwenhoekiella sp. NPDC079379]|uniref:DUF6452 family protein n=1 Tax=Leeuwenhoekiella sp. NPDC079379 TaxID=3364122 RepID=UPI0037C94C1E
MIKKWFLLMICVLLLSLSCERDDICATSTPTTPQLTIGFFDSDNVNEAKPLNITIYKQDRSDSIVYTGASTIQIPLRTDTTATVLVFVKNPNNLVAAEDPNNADTVTFTYVPQETFISRACGYRVVFNNLTIQTNPGPDARWIDDLIINNRTIANEDTTQVFIRH